MAQEQILPKGIVLNRNTVYEEIAKYDVLPVEQILRAYHVFSTTSRELYDPTARRLENFWTRVLGGDRRYLSGTVIAQLFKDISEETSFVKLRGPLNRYEPPSPKSSDSSSHSMQTASVMSTSKPNNGATTSSIKALHPILKKPRGPSASGPRPTARFASPAGSELDEDGARESGTTTSTTATVHSVSSKDSASSRTKEEKRKGHGNKSKKKTTAFVASTSSRRRPTMPRRTSSQSSAGASDMGSKEGDSSLGSKYDGSQSSVPTIPEKPEQQTTSTDKGKGSTSLSAKAAGKRPITESHIEKSISKPETLPSSQSQDETASARQNVTEIKQQSPPVRLGKKKKGAASSQNRPKTLQSMVVQNKDDTQGRPHPESSPSMNKSSSDVSSMRPTSREASRAVVIPPSSLMSSTLAKLDTSVIGQATISGFAESIPSQEPSTGRFSGQSDDTGSHERASQSLGASGFPSQFTPTQPSNTVTIPLGRSKSQLALLLDRQGERKPRR
ncbi:hypothetical protein HD806DRAFT_550641 [Xylariaceae sp. AK1471]|nr:hypothetical protein HD806DRAFT_550641 [Xylariaceae sp. AK1471]